jgi:hypothetical protein
MADAITNANSEGEHDAEPRRRGSLTVVGTGIKAWGHLTEEALEAIRGAEKVHHAVADTMMRARLHELNPGAERLPDYLPGRPRRETYALWVEIVMRSVRAGLRTCAAAYGHPGVLVQFTRDAIRMATEEGYPAVMLPGISSEACLLCDLLVDPGPEGWQSYGATVFLKRRPRFDTGTPLVLWQIQVINQPGPPGEIDRAALARLAAMLAEHYGREHQVVVYEASRNPAIDPVVQLIPLDRLADVRIRVSATLYVPPLEP